MPDEACIINLYLISIPYFKRHLQEERVHIFHFYSLKNRKNTETSFFFSTNSIDVPFPNRAPSHTLTVHTLTPKKNQLNNPSWVLDHIGVTGDGLVVWTES